MSNSNSIPLPKGPRFKNLTGRVFSRLTVIEYAGMRGRYPTWACLCECGTRKVVQGTYLTSGHTKSCGCFRREVTSQTFRRHGSRDNPEYSVWVGMWDRCTNPNNLNYDLYASRCPPDEWRDFSVFLEDVGPRPGRGMSLDRIDNDKPYGPGNCRWATQKVQCNNTSRNVHLTYDGVTLTLPQWSDVLGMRSGTLRSRLDSYGWSIEKALTTPVR